MATHDYNIANQTGADFRADLNNALLAIVSNNSNATSPSTTYAYQLWVDTSNNVLKLRNSANSDWITTGISITASNSFTGDITGNSATATALATARTINGVSFDGTANISFNTDSVSEGSSNLYFTNERVDDQVNSLLTAGSGISLTYDDAAGTLTIANTNSADITSVVAGDGLTGGGTSGDVTLAVSVDDSSIEINSDTLRVKASGITNAMLAGSIANDKLAGSIANSKLANSSVTINSQAISLGGSHTFDSDDIGEGSSNLYFTNARSRASLSVGSEGSASGNGAIAYNSSTGVFTYTPPVISGLSGDTDDLSEGSSNLYYTDARSNAAIDARVTNTFINNLSGVVADTATALATARSIALSGDVTASGVNFDGTGDITLSTTIGANSVALGTDTTGNYVAGISGTTNEIEVSGSGSETASVTIGLPDNVTIAGDLTVNGTTTTVNTSTLEVEDPLIKLAKANSGADSVDIGFYGLYDTSGSQDLYAGLFRDASDSGKFKLFKDLQAEPTTTVNTSGTGYAVGTLVSNLEGDVTGTLQTAAQPNITSVGTLTTLTVDDITIDGSTISDGGILTITAGDDFIVDAEGDINLDANGGDIRFKDNGTVIGQFTQDANNFVIQSAISDEDLIFKGNDGGSTITALTLDMSDAGTATFNHDIKLGDNGKVIFGAGDDLQIYHDSSDSYIQDLGTGNLYLTTDGSTMNLQAGSDNMIKIYKDAQVEIFHDASVKLATTSSGITVTGNIANSSGDLTIDVAGDIILDAGGDDITFKSGGTEFGGIFKNSNDMFINSAISDGDIKFRGNDGGSFIIPLTLDMSDAGKAIFTAGATFGNNVDVTGTVTADGITNAGGFSTITGSTGASNQASINSGTTTGENLYVANTHRYLNGAGSEQMRITGTSVGIGTTSPTGKVNIVSSSSGSYLLNLDYNDNTDGGGFFQSGSVGLSLLLKNSSATQTVQVATEGVSYFNGGNVGIGTSSPDDELDVEGADPAIRLTDTSASGYARMFANNGSLLLQADEGNSVNNSIIGFDVDGTERARIDSSGNVGIGTTSPEEALHVSGNMVLDRAAPRLFFQTGSTHYNWKVSTQDSVNKGFEISSGEVDADANSDTYTARLVIEGDTGQVGLGTSSPSSLLHCVASGADAKIKVETDGGNDAILELIAPAASGAQSKLMFSDDSASGVGSIVYAHNSGGTDYMTFGTASTERMRIDSSGMLGLGTTPPTDSHSTWSQFFIGQKGSVISERLGSGGLYGTYITDNLYVDSDTGNFAYRVANEASAYLQEASTHRWYTVASGSAGAAATLSERMRIDGSNLLVGKTSSTGVATGNIEVSNSSSASVQIEGGTNEWSMLVSSSADALRFYQDSSEIMRIDSSGRLGVGTTSPSDKLHLNGAANASTGLTIGNNNSTRLRLYHDDNAGASYITTDGMQTEQQLRVGSGSFLAFDTAGSERMRIDSSGNLLVGKTSGTSGNKVETDGRISAGAGSTGQPTFNCEGDTNTGINLPESDRIQLITGGTEAMRIDSSQRVGIGTTSPAEMLHVTGDIRVDTDLILQPTKILYLDGGNDTYINEVAANEIGFNTAGGERIRISGSNLLVGKTSSTGVATGNIEVSNSSSASVQIEGGTHEWSMLVSSSADALRFYQDSSEIMRLDSSGNLGLGETSPDQKLHINSGTDNINTKFESTDTEVRLQLKDSTGTAFIAARNDIRFGNDTTTERMRINVNGHILLGTTSNQGVGGISFEKGGSGFTTHNNNDGASGGYEFYVFRRSSTQIGSIAQSSTNAVQYNTSSDARLKNVTGSSRGLDVINNLNPVAYNWKSDNHADEGLIAQEVEELVPNAVSQSEDGYYQMDYSKLVTHLVKGMQEQQEQIESLKSEIANLKGE